MENNILDLAIENFEQKNYDKALELLILSYEKEDCKEWILENIYNCTRNYLVWICSSPSTQ